MKGTDLILRGETQAVLGATGIELTLSQTAERIDILPDTTDEREEQWEHYRPGQKSWSITHDGLYIVEMAEGLTTDFLFQEDVKFKAHIVFRPNQVEVNYIGMVHLQDVEISAAHNSLSKFTANLVGDDFPTI